jgi:SAM-dependent methyltransferase
MQKIDILSKEYTKSYISNASELFDIPYISNILPKKIAELLPNNYIAVDIGSCDGLYSENIIKYVSENNGHFENVDLYPIKSTVIESDAVEFMKKTNKNFDLIICKHAVHLFTPLEQFFNLCYDKLSSNGRLFIITLTNETIIPWSIDINKHFMNTFINIESFLKQWNVIIHKGNVNKTCDVATLCNIIKNHSLSFLYKNSDEELNSCINNLQSLPNKTVDVELYYNIYELSR